MYSENCCLRFILVVRPPVFPCSRPVIPLLIGAGFRAKAHSDQSVSGKRRRKRSVSGEICRSRPQPSGRKPRNSAASPPGLLQIRCICSKTAIARRPTAGPAPRTIGTGARSVRLQIRCKCSQTPIASPPEAGDGYQQRHAMPRGGYHDVGGYQFRGGNTPASAMHWVKGWPVAVKMGFAVGSAKVVVPLPP